MTTVLLCAIALQVVGQAPPNDQPQGDATVQWVSAIILAATGIFIAWQAWETKRAARAAAASVEAINTQAGIMERQTRATEMAAEAAKVSADASKQSAEIAAALHRPFMGLTRFGLKTDPNSRTWIIAWTIKNFGTLPATQVDAALEWKVGINGGTGPGPSSVEIFPEAEEESTVHFVLDETIHRQLLTNNQILELHARIKYSAADGRHFLYTADAQWRSDVFVFAVLKSQTQSQQ